jgi:hypothetical protein
VITSISLEFWQAAMKNNFISRVNGIFLLVILNLDLI